MTEHIRESISRAKKCFTKRSKLHNQSENVLAYLVYFGGRSEKIEDEIRGISEVIRYNNFGKFVWGKTEEGIIIPCFDAKDNEGGEVMSEGTNTRVGMSDAYFEIIGDGFGDTSYALAKIAYKTAKKLEIPTRILVKKKREANHPKYASEFLAGINKKLILPYKDAFEARDLVDDCLEHMFR